MAKYLIEKNDKETIIRVYVNNDGKADFAQAYLAPYIEPDLEQVRKEAYDTAYADAEEIYESGKRVMYQKGLKDAWEAARKICLKESDGGLTVTEIDNIFNVSFYRDAIKDYSASEAVEKIRQYEQEKEQYEQEKEMDGLRQNIQTIVDQCGYTLDEIAEVLQKMREETE